MTKIMQAVKDTIDVLGAAPIPPSIGRQSLPFTFPTVVIEDARRHYAVGAKKPVETRADFYEMVGFAICLDGVRSVAVVADTFLGTDPTVRPSLDPAASDAIVVVERTREALTAETQMYALDDHGKLVWKEYAGPAPIMMDPLGQFSLLSDPDFWERLDSAHADWPRDMSIPLFALYLLERGLVVQ